MTDVKQQTRQTEIGAPNTSTTGAIVSPSQTFQNLDQSQQNLLLAALNSQKPFDTSQDLQTSPQMASLNNDLTPDLYDFDGDADFDFDNADLGGELIDSSFDDEGAELHEKRKNPDDPSTPESGDAKRQETQDGEKGAKKPGRKPLTNEPTTKRKAQNRAAQRAFRERKEKHLKDLATQVNDLTKASEADKHENGLLRAQVDRLQVELREYRKRLSLNGGASRSPPMSSAADKAARNSFTFDFPKFGSLPATHLGGNGLPASITPPLSTDSPISMTQPGMLSRHNSEGRSMSPGTVNAQSQSPQVSSDLNNFQPVLPYSTSNNLHGFASTLPQMANKPGDPFGDLFSPSLLKSVTANAENSYFETAAAATTAPVVNNGGDSTAGIPDNRVFRFNSGSIASDSASPSTSSLSQWNNNTTNSSCGTSPEPLNDSPATNTKQLETNANKNLADQYSFTQLPQTDANANFGFDITNNSFNVPAADSFDPVLFGDYRDTTDNIVGGGDFTGGFFDDGINSAPIDFGSPSTLFGILANPSPAPASAATPSRNLMAEMDKARDGGDDDYGLPVATSNTQQADAAGKKSGSNFISCTKIWNQLQSNPDFQDGKFDLDGLCTELRTKARCSESGLLVDSDQVDAALKRLTKAKTQTKQQSPVQGSTPAQASTTEQDAAKKAAWLMFEQESWDNVLKKLGSGKNAKPAGI